MSSRPVFVRPLAFFGASLGLGLGLSAPFWLAAGPVPNAFVDGTVASATAVNQNFVSVTDRLDALEGKALTLKKQHHEILGSQSIGSPNIPFDNTVPQISEGTKIFDVSFSPTAVGSTIEIESVVHLMTTRSGGDNYTTALFVNGGANAVRSAIVWGNQDRAEAVVLRYQFQTTSLAPIALQLNAGGNGATTTWLNTHTAANYGNTVPSTFTITERR